MALVQGWATLQCIGLLLFIVSQAKFQSKGKAKNISLRGPDVARGPYVAPSWYSGTPVYFAFATTVPLPFFFACCILLYASMRVSSSASNSFWGQCGKPNVPKS